VSQIPPPRVPLNYQQPYYAPLRPPTRYPVRKFLGGMAAGTLLSAILWPFSFSANRGDAIFSLVIVVLFLKLGAGISFLCMRPYRMIGGGIMTSVALGFLIFFGVCATNIKF
jgi:hypothetical protein